MGWMEMTNELIDGYGTFFHAIATCALAVDFLSALSNYVCKSVGATTRLC